MTPEEIELSVQSLRAAIDKRPKLEAAMEGDFDTSVLNFDAEKRLRAHNEMTMNIRTNLYSKKDLTPRQIEWCRKDGLACIWWEADKE